MRAPVGRGRGVGDIPATSGSVWSWARVSTPFLVQSAPAAAAPQAGSLGSRAAGRSLGARVTPLDVPLTAAPAPLLTQVTWSN